MLFVMAIACVVLAIGERSFGWFIGGIVFAGVAMFARSQLSKEHEEGQEGPRLGFVGIAIGVMLVVMFLLFKLQSSG
jgi:hypothetical protein